MAPGSGTHDHPGEYDTIDELWAGVDPAKDPLDTKVIEEWTAQGITYTRLYFTGEYWEGEPTRIYAIQGAPAGARDLPGILHIHGGGQTASQEWVTFWAKRGYACVSFDFCGDWTKFTPDRKEFTKWGRLSTGMDLSGRWMRPNARHDPWFHWAYTARRALTLLCRHPACDPEKIGIYGISVGGTLTWLVAGTDSRVKVAAPIYGCGWNTYNTPDQKPADAVDPEVLAWRELLQSESYAPRVKCPLLFLDATQDFHGQLDRCVCTMNMLGSSVKRQVFTPRYNHHIEAREGRSLPLWMDWQLKGVGGPWPETPKISIAVHDHLSEITLVTDHADTVESVEINYALNNPNPSGRFWRISEAKNIGRGTWTAPAVISGTTDTVYAFGNVTYKSGVTISSTLLTVPAQSLAGVTPTLIWQAEIDPMKNDRSWYYVPAYTDPVIDSRYFVDWTGPQGARGFTLNPKVFGGSEFDFHMATCKLGDPQWRGHEGCELALDYYGPQPFAELTVKLVENEGKPSQREFTLKVEPQEAGEGWRTITITLGDAKAADGKALKGWGDVNTLALVGKSTQFSPPVFHNLRWKE